LEFINQRYSQDFRISDIENNLIFGPFHGQQYVIDVKVMKIGRWAVGREATQKNSKKEVNRYVPSICQNLPLLMRFEFNLAQCVFQYSLFAKYQCSSIKGCTFCGVKTLMLAKWIMETAMSYA
jgi:hypothetical protein